MLVLGDEMRIVPLSTAISLQTSCIGSSRLSRAGCSSLLRHLHLHRFEAHHSFFGLSCEIDRAWVGDDYVFQTFAGNVDVKEPAGQRPQNIKPPMTLIYFKC